MDQDWRRKTQIILAIFFVIALIRVGVIFYDRTHVTEAPKPEPTSSSRYKVTLDDYVTPHKLFPYDLNSARELVGKTVWVRTGNQVAYYSYQSETRRVDLAHKAGLLGPLEKLEVKDVIAQGPHRHGRVMAIFTKAEAPGEYAAIIGTIEDDVYTFNINEIFFIEDPHGLYNHWPADVWNAIDHHEAKLGMNELQVGFALGTDIRATPGDYGNRTVEYTAAGKTLMVVAFSDNRAVSVHPPNQ